jgi:hypothetical protein
VPIVWTMSALLRYRKMRRSKLSGSLLMWSESDRSDELVAGLIGYSPLSVVVRTVKLRRENRLDPEQGVR